MFNCPEHGEIKSEHVFWNEVYKAVASYIIHGIIDGVATVSYEASEPGDTLNGYFTCARCWKRVEPVSELEINYV